MKSHKQMVLAVGLAAVAVVIGVQLMSDTRSTSHIEATLTPSMRMNEPPASTPAGVDRSILAAPAALSSPAASAVPADNDWQRTFATARDWRAFALAAKNHPESGGRFYAIHAANLCARDNLSIQQIAQAGQAKQLTATGTVSNERLALTDSWVTRCGAFVPAEAGELVDSLRALAKDGADPLLVARQTLLDAKKRSDATEVRESVRRMLATGDSLLLSADDLLMLAMSFQPKNPNERSYWFDGKSYDVFDASGDALMLKMRTQYLQSPGASPDRFLQVLALADKVRGAIQARNVDAFVRPG